MASCAHCGEAIEQPFTCRHCDRGYCGEHRLPEKHECPASVPTEHKVTFSSKETEVESKVETPEPMQVSRSPATQGGDQTPDVARDGSLEEFNDDAWNASDDDREESGTDWWLLLRLNGLRAKNKIRTVVALVGIAAVILGGYNMFSLVLGTPSFRPYSGIIGPLVFQTAGGGVGVLFLGDVAAMTVGAIVTWIS